jgi:hypothetical protein
MIERERERERELNVVLNAKSYKIVSVPVSSFLIRSFSRKLLSGAKQRSTDPKPVALCHSESDTNLAITNRRNVRERHQQIG